MTEWERPQYILANGKRAFVVLSVGQYELLIDALEDASDLAEMERRRGCVSQRHSIEAHRGATWR